MSSVNKVILLGNVGKDPEIRVTQNGTSVANFSIATSTRWKDRATGEKKERTEWHRVVVFNDGLVKVIEQYLRKGTKVYIEGQLQTRKWADKAGADHYMTEVVLPQFGGALVLLSGKDEGQQQAQPGYTPPPDASSTPPANQYGDYDDYRSPIIDDEIPF